MSEQSLRDLVAEVAAAYFSSSHVAPSDISNVVGQIAESLRGVGQSQAPAALVAEDKPRSTRAQIRKSVTPDALISFEDGKGYKTLRRHLSIRGLTPAQYREKWGLPADYPMVAASYSAARSELAKQLGLGQKLQAARQKAPRKGRRRAPRPEPVAEG